MRFLFRSLSGLFITFLTFGLLFVAGFQLFQAMSSRGSGGMAREGQEQVYTARLLTVAPGAVQPVMQVFGTVESRRRLQLRSGAAGQIVYLDPAMQEGGQVRQGQLLVRVDPSAAQAALDNQLAARDDAQASLADAERNVQVATDDLAAAERQTELRRAALTRQESLADRGLGTSADRETAELAVSTAEQAVIAGRSALAAAESAVTAAQNALRRAEIDLSEARRELADTEIRAGFAGRVTSVTAVEGGLVSLNEQLAEIIDPASLEVQVPLSLDQYARLLTENGRLQDLPAMVVLDGSAGRLTSRARLDRAAASVAEGSAGRIVYARILSDSDVLRPGDFVSVEISEPQIANAALLPAAAVGNDGSVLVADAEGRLTAMPVSVLRRQGDDVIVEVPAALAGARIVAERAPQLGTGIRVRDAAAPVPAQDQRALNTQGKGNG
ncbi:HlyD family efflux transporter periplasmic adaptor subunit [Paracoccus sp. YLB-12]|uniref:HlyD family efflux transporter periplasmic adaptor subunit n=1 Tax=Paracoccus maritimus TaxID=2933292 RepID=A0ABT2K5C3_9RHOB|nr:HlyD family efflux transporter periplasmic adaptor subunit [Paracoccus sp. YLB-12]MCT4331743.1 HlyD family efflux transporter periplasmic adaptor subunit [Paracoccus sp. YLB-12]